MKSDFEKKRKMYLIATAALSLLTSVTAFSTCSTRHSYRSGTTQLSSYDPRGESFMVKEFAEYEQLEEIVKLASQPLPERPDGIVAVAKYTSANIDSCRNTEADYERLARGNPSTIFLRCFAEYQNADILIGKASIQNWPTFDVFYGGNRVARVEGPNYAEVEALLERYQFINSKLDLFSESAANPWGERSGKDMAAATPRTTNRFIPGYDWNSDKGFFDAAGDKAAQSFEEQYENSWLPQIDDDDKK